MVKNYIALLLIIFSCQCSNKNEFKNNLFRYRSVSLKIIEQFEEKAPLFLYSIHSDSNLIDSFFEIKSFVLENKIENLYIESDSTIHYKRLKNYINKEEIIYYYKNTYYQVPSKYIRLDSNLFYYESYSMD